MPALTRRRFLTLAPALGLAAMPDDRRLRVYRDAATEMEVVRYTDPEYTSRLLPAHRRSVTRRSRAAIICSDAGGSGLLPATLDLRTGEISPVPGVTGPVAPEALELTADERSIAVLSAGAVRIVPLSGGRGATVHEPGRDSEVAEFQAAPDGRGVYVLERGRRGSAIRRSAGRGRPAETLAAGESTWSDLRVRPNRPGLLWRSEGVFWYAERAAAPPEQLGLAGNVLQTLWTVDGRALLYLSRKDSGSIELREHVPDTAQDRLIGATTRFATFAANRDASVFAGLSGSSGAPYVLLLLRVTRRELTLCEHRTSNAPSSAVLFTPDSQRVLFETDRQGRTAIHGVSTAKLVEETGSDSQAQAAGAVSVWPLRRSRSAAAISS